MNIGAHVFISGKVQGVFYRIETSREAKKRNITGWIRNTSDGRVEAIFEGERRDVTCIIDFCKHGPSGALVEKVNVLWEKYTGNFEGFEIRKTKFIK
jgi:acylphosphatase